MASDFLSFFQRVHGVGSALVNVQLRDLVLIFHLQHVGHRRFPGIRDALLVRRTDQAHIEPGAAAHRRDVDNFHTITVQVIAHEAGKQVLKGMNASFRHHFLVWHAESQIENGDFIAVRRVHFLRDTHRRRFHSGMVDCETI
ncbi:Uncharacterised protein [Klebsiella pneumoniae]|nr:Uncharacterised protein [Klebsiella pneumoniae]